MMNVAMLGWRSSIRSLALSVCLGVALMACAPMHSVLEIVPPKSVSPTGEIAVKIIEVHDSRYFTPGPSDPSQPTLYDEAIYKDPSITARTIAAIRDIRPYYKKLPPYLYLELPKGVTVASLVRETAQAALQDKGYRVVDESSPNYAAAMPMALNVDKFWAWMSSDARGFVVSFEAQVVMVGDQLVGVGPTVVNGFAETSGIFSWPEDWPETIQKGLADLAVEMKRRIKPPSELSKPKESSWRRRENLSAMTARFQTAAY